MEQVQAIVAERDEARSEATRLREGGGIEDLQEKQQAIAAIIRSEMQSWEEPARRASKKRESEFLGGNVLSNARFFLVGFVFLFVEGSPNSQTVFFGSKLELCQRTS